MVKGRAIVNHTRNGTRHGWLSADHYVNEYNDRMIRQAEGAGSRILNDFLANWQSNLGQSIVEASLAHMSVLNKIQEEIGEAIVRVATVQTSYEEADAALQVKWAPRSWLRRMRQWRPVCPVRWSQQAWRQAKAQLPAGSEPGPRSPSPM